MYISVCYPFKLKKIKTHQLDSELVLSNLLKQQRENLIINSNQNVSQNIILNFNKLITRRATREPLAYILKNKEFWSKDFFVDRNILIPRPETELIVEWTLDLSLNKNSTIVEVGTGSGCIAISIYLKNRDLKILATDLSDAALKVAQINRERLNAFNVTFMQANWLAASIENSLDLVISNPPYIKPNDPHLRDLHHEPLIALTSENGSNSFFHIASKAIYSLKRGGKIIFEHGYSQASEVSNILKDFGFKNI